MEKKSEFRGVPKTVAVSGAFRKLIQEKRMRFKLLTTINSNFQKHSFAQEIGLKQNKNRLSQRNSCNAKMYPLLVTVNSERSEKVLNLCQNNKNLELTKKAFELKNLKLENDILKSLVSNTYFKKNSLVLCIHLNEAEKLSVRFRVSLRELSKTLVHYFIQRKGKLRDEEIKDMVTGKINSYLGKVLKFPHDYTTELFKFCKKLSKADPVLEIKEHAEIEALKELLETYIEKQILCQEDQDENKHKKHKTNKLGSDFYLKEAMLNLPEFIDKSVWSDEKLMLVNSLAHLPPCEQPQANSIKKMSNMSNFRLSQQRKETPITLMKLPVFPVIKKKLGKQIDFVELGRNEVQDRIKICQKVSKMKEFDGLDFIKFLALVESVESQQKNPTRVQKGFNQNHLLGMKQMLDDYFSRKDLSFAVEEKLGLIDKFIEKTIQ